MLTNFLFNKKTDSSFVKRLIFDPQRTKCIGDSFHMINPRFTYENKTIKTKDNINLRVTLVIPQTIDEFTKFFVFCHGSSVNRGYYAKSFEKYNLLDENICVLLLDYREYGNSEGVFTKQGSVYDLDACMKYFYKRFNKKIHLIGSSLGTGVILEYCNSIYENKGPILFDKLVLMSSFTSITNLLKETSIWRLFKLFPSQLIKINTLYNFDSLENIKSVKEHKILILHGINDQMVPISHAKKMVEASGGMINFFEEDHFSLSLSFSAWKRIFEFLDSN